MTEAVEFTVTQTDIEDALLDITSHEHSWRSGLLAARKAADEVDISYWDHELKAFNRTFKVFKVLKVMAGGRPTRYELILLAQQTTCDILGYNNWQDANDYRMTGRDDQKRDQTFQTIYAVLCKTHLYD